MDLPDLNFTPPAEDVDEMDENAENEMEGHVGDDMEGDAGEGMEGDEIVQNPGAGQVGRKNKTLNDQQKFAAYVALHTLCMSRGGTFKKTDTQDIANFFGVGVWNIQRIWRKAMLQIQQGQEVDVADQRKGNSGRKPKDINLEKILTIPLNRRSTIRSLAWQLGCSPTTLHRKFMLNLIRRHTNCVKPALKEKNKMDRMNFCLSMLDEATTATARPKFKTMHNVVHIDEKWFNMTKKNRTYYLLDGEEEPTRPIHGNCIGKVMFLTAVARPRWDSEGNVTFSGKIGIWPFVKEVPAQRRSDNRPKGTIETKSIKVDRKVMREFLIEKVLPAIQAVWPGGEEAAMAAVTRRLRGWMDRIQAFAQGEVEAMQELERAVF
ncbi:uncharacterized protein LOC125531796, partial [Triticum urartu]|uniref:uncharacterized protein LOC125531796 n=1 Tax=Triticum urartu TaxID=4572 RepID=UPI00204343B3